MRAYDSKQFLVAFAFIFWLFFWINIVEADLIDPIMPKSEKEEILIVSQDHIDKYIEWRFEEINLTHWNAKLSFSKSFKSNLDKCLSNPSNSPCWNSLKELYFPNEDVKNLKTSLMNLNQYPLKNLTENIRFSNSLIDLSTGKASFYIIFEDGFEPGESAKFGFNSTIITTMESVTSTNAPFRNYAGQICRTDNNIIHTVWGNFTAPGVNVTYANSTDGITWNVTKLDGAGTGDDLSTAAAAQDPHPVIACKGTNVFVVWDSGADLRYMNSSDEGKTWAYVSGLAPIWIQASGKNLRHPSAFFGIDNNTWVVFSYDNGNIETLNITNSSSYRLDSPTMTTMNLTPTDAGSSTWPRSSLIVNYTSTDEHIWVAWGTGNARDLLFNWSTNGGSTWSGVTINTSGAHTFPSLNILNNTFYIASHDVTTEDVYIFNATDPNTWSGALRLDEIGTGTSKAQYPSIAADIVNNNITVFWQQNDTVGNRKWDIVYKTWNISHDWSGVVTWQSLDSFFSPNPSAKFNNSADKLEVIFASNTSIVDDLRVNISYDFISTPAAPAQGGTTTTALLTDFITFETTNGKGMTRIVLPTQSINIIENRQAGQTLIKSLINGIGLAENIQMTLTRLRLLTDSLDIADNIQSIIIRVRLLTNEIDISETVQRLASLTKLLTNSIDVSDAIASNLTRLRELTNSIDLTETVNMFIELPRQLIEALDVADRITAFVGRARTITDAFNATDNIGNLFIRVRLMANAIDLTEATTRLASLTKLLTNAVSTTNNVISSVGRLSQLTQALDISENIQLYLTRARSATNDIALSGNTRILFSLSRLFTNSISFASQISTSVSQSFTVNINQALDITDNIQSIIIRVRLLTDNIDISETVQRLASLTKLLTNSIDLTETVNMFIELPRQLIEALDVADRITAFVGRARTITDAFNATDNIGNLFIRVRLMANAIDLTEATIRLTSVIKSLTNTVGINENITNSLNRLRQLSNGIDFTDNLIINFSRFRMLTQGLDESESATRIISFIRNLSDFSNFAERSVSNLTRLRLLINSFSLTDSLASTISGVSNRAITLSLSMTDNIRQLFTNIRFSTNAINITNVMQRIQSLTKTIQNNISLSQLLERSRSMEISILGAFSLSDTVGRLIEIPRSITESLDISDINSRLASLQRITSLQFLVNAIVSPTYNTVSATFSVPTSSVVKGEFAEFDFNVINTGNGVINLTTGIDVYNSSNNLINTINSTNIVLSTGKSRTIATFLNTINISAGTYRTEGVLLFDDRSTVNITKNFTVTSATNIQVGDYINTSINITSGIPTLITANTSSSTTTNLSIVLNSTKEGGIVVAEFSSFENQTVSGQTKLGKFVSLTVTPNITDNLQWSWLNISYTDAEVTSAGVDESGLKIWFYNRTTSSWQAESNTGVEVSSNYVWANISHFSLFGVFSTTTSQTSSQPPSSAPAGGGSVANVSAPIKPFETSKIRFAKLSVLREVVAGQSAVEGIRIENIAGKTLNDLAVHVSGVPASWIDIVPKSLSLSSGETKGFNLIISVPKGADVGDYKLLITLKNNEVEDSGFMIIRVKDYAALQDKPIVTRTVQLDYEMNKTKIVLEVNNPLRFYPLVQIEENIPKNLATTVKEIEFITPPDKIINEDPVVQWDLPDLKINDSRDIVYLTKGILDEFSTYIYMPLKELRIVETRFPSGLKFDVSIPKLSAGKSTIAKLKIENSGDADKNLAFSMSLPKGWRMEPEKIIDVVKPNEKKEFKFSIIVPENASQGDYISTAIIDWGTETHIKEIVLKIGPDYSKFVIVAVIVAAGISIYIIASRRRKYKSYHSRHPRILGKLKNIIKHGSHESHKKSKSYNHKR